MSTPPAWFSDAKLGIFIHWGIFCVPARRLDGATLNAAEGPSRVRLAEPFAGPRPHVIAFEGAALAT
jgi:hypothetical protein